MALQSSETMLKDSLMQVEGDNTARRMQIKESENLIMGMKDDIAAVKTFADNRKEEFATRTDGWKKTLEGYENDHEKVMEMLDSDDLVQQDRVLVAELCTAIGEPDVSKVASLRRTLHRLSRETDHAQLKLQAAEADAEKERAFHIKQKAFLKECADERAALQEWHAAWGVFAKAQMCPNCYAPSQVGPVQD
eukprot:TRINITY_DN1780_c0_g1_i1.p1 TRINITY_DN1780_c0_g1~~TRINITY_DN1780_c0_g1_i1.p1  ORF type:complete len:192 (+),score=24.25 TRINITY_DN1780_c0_g1_i1:346-921(+)